MSEALPEQGSVHGQDCVVAGARAGKLRIEEDRAAEENYEQEESHTGDENQAAGVHTVVMYASGVRVDAGSHCVLAGTAAAGTVAPAGLVGIADTVVLVGLVELADSAVSVGLAGVADSAVPGIVGSADTAAPGSLVFVAETAASTEILAVAGTAEWADVAEIVGTAVPGIVDFADTAAIAGIVGPVSIVEIVDNAEAAAGTVDIAAATEWQPSLSTII